MENEIWKDIPGLPYNRVSSLGRIMSLDKPVKNGYDTISVKKGKILKQYIIKSGYYTVCISYPDGHRKTTKVHRLIALAFVDNPLNKPDINHRDGVKTNNLPANLEWCTQSENCKHRDKMHQRSSINRLTKSITLTNIHTGDKQSFVSMGMAAKHFNVGKSNVQQAFKRKFNLLRLYKIELCV